MKQLTDKEIKALWGEAEKKPSAGRRVERDGGQMSGSRSLLWIVLALLGAGYMLVNWIQTNMGTDAAAAAIGILATVVIVVVLRLLDLASRRIDSDMRIGELQATSRVAQEEAKGRNIELKAQMQMQLKQNLLIMSLIKPLLRAQLKEPEATPAAEPNTIDLEEVRQYRWSDSDL